MLDIWLAHVLRYSRRDQLSLNVALKRARLTPEVLRIDNHESYFHSWPKGIISRPANFKRLATPFLSCPAAKAYDKAHELGKKNARLERDLAKERLKRLSSTSWRITAPLRMVVEMVRSFRRSPAKKRLR
jgi:hypothetical protein